MSDLISRQDAIEAFADMRNGYPVFHGDMLSDKDVNEIIKDLPSAQPERKKGEWILAEDGWYCSVCELYPPFDCDPEEKGIPYCPNCGADMKGEEHETD